MPVSLFSNTIRQLSNSALCRTQLLTIGFYMTPSWTDVAPCKHSVSLSGIGYVIGWDGIRWVGPLGGVSYLWSTLPCKKTNNTHHLQLQFFSKVAGGLDVNLKHLTSQFSQDQHTLKIVSPGGGK